jgi:hypothetical protein
MRCEAHRILSRKREKARLWQRIERVYNPLDEDIAEVTGIADSG